MQQGDQYTIPITVTLGSVPVTDQNVVGLKVQFGDVVKEWPGDITYDDGSFLYPITQEETMALGGVAPFQVQINTDNTTILTSDVGTLEVGRSLIMEAWDE